MRRRFIYDRASGEMVEVSAGYAAPERVAPDVIGDIKRPFRSMADGSVIESRSQYRDHLKRHGMRVVDPSEVSTEKIASHKPNYDAAPQQRRELIRAQVDAMPHEAFKAAIKRDIDNWKWNSRK